MIHNDYVDEIIDIEHTLIVMVKMLQIMKVMVIFIAVRASSKDSISRKSVIGFSSGNNSRNSCLSSISSSISSGITRSSAGYTQEV